MAGLLFSNAIPVGSRFSTPFPDIKLKQKTPLRQETLSLEDQIEGTEQQGTLDMKKTLFVIAASTALGIVIGLPAWSAIHRDGEHSVLRGNDRSDLTWSDDARSDGEHGRSHLWFVSDDDDRGHGRVGYEDDEDDDDDERGGYRNNPAPAGTVTPPKNGLFGNTTPPRVQVN